MVSGWNSQALHNWKINYTFTSHTLKSMPKILGGSKEWKGVSIKCGLSFLTQSVNEKDKGSWMQMGLANNAQGHYLIPSLCPVLD